MGNVSSWSIPEYQNARNLTTLNALVLETFNGGYILTSGPTAPDSDWSDIPFYRNERKFTKEKRRTKGMISRKILICAK